MDASDLPDLINLCRSLTDGVQLRWIKQLCALDVSASERLRAFSNPPPAATPVRLPRCVPTAENSNDTRDCDYKPKWKGLTSGAAAETIRPVCARRGQSPPVGAFAATQCSWDHTARRELHRAPGRGVSTLV